MQHVERYTVHLNLLIMIVILLVVSLIGISDKHVLA